MKPLSRIKVQKNTLLEALKKASKARLSSSRCEKMGKDYIFCCFVFHLGEPGILKVMTSDYHKHMTVSVPLVSERGFGTFAAVPEDLLPILRRLDNQDLIIEFNECRMTVCHSYGTFTLPLVTEGIGNFVKLYVNEKHRSTCHKLELEASFFRSMLNRLRKHTDYGLRPVLAGICIRRKGGRVDFIASNGLRLMCITKPDEEITLASTLVISNECVEVLKRITPTQGNVLLEYTEWKEDSNETPICRFKTDDEETSFWFTLTGGKYPDYNKVIPKNSPYSCVIEKKELFNSLDRLHFFASVSDIVRVKVKNGYMQIFAKDKDFDIESSESLECEKTGKNFKFALKTENVCELLSTLHCKKVRILAGEPERAIVVMPDVQPENENITTLFMPCAVLEDDEE